MKLRKANHNANIDIEDPAITAHASRRLEEDDDVLFVEKHKKRNRSTSFDKKHIIFLVTGITGLVGGIACLVAGIVLSPGTKTALDFSGVSTSAESSATYSTLTGEPLADSSLKNSPAYCVQTPNGTDGARPQVGLTEAGVVFEAIAEAGITRFAAIYQNPKSAIIGPIRSLRMYYLEWDTPFDCTIVHAGGADDALSAVASGGYKDLSEDYSYMYRGTYGSRLWNNLFTTSAYLQKYSTDSGHNTSDIKGFTTHGKPISSAARLNSSYVLA